MIETSKSITVEELLLNLDFRQRKTKTFKNIELFNSNDIIHKLSHQELYIKFWKINTNCHIGNMINLKDVQNHAFPVVIAQFIKDFVY